MFQSYSLPLKRSSMGDIKMNGFPQATDCEYIYIELADGTQGKIKKSDFFSSLVIGINYPNGDINDLKKNGIYYVGSNPTAQKVEMSLICVFASHPSVMQVGYNSSKTNTSVILKIRFILRGNDASYTTWSDWKTISFE